MSLKAVSWRLLAAIALAAFCYLTIGPSISRSDSRLRWNFAGPYKRANFFCPMLAKLSKLRTSALRPANVKVSLSAAPNRCAPRFRSPGLRVEPGSKVGSNWKCFFSPKRG